jgi:hypothetical protein
MSREEIFVGEVGHTFEVTVKEDGSALDISGASVKQIIFERPSGTTFTEDAVFVTDGSDGLIKHVTEADDLDESGRWAMQGYFTLGVWTGYSDKEFFWVKDPL